MIHIRNQSDLHLITHDPELWREVYGYISVCISEFQEYADYDDLAVHDFNFSLISEEDINYINALGTPEEIVKIEIQPFDTTRIIYRVIFVTEVLFIPGELAQHLSIIDF